MWGLWLAIFILIIGIVGVAQIQACLSDSNSIPGLLNLNICLPSTPIIYLFLPGGGVFVATHLSFPNLFANDICILLLNMLIFYLIGCCLQWFYGKKNS